MYYIIKFHINPAFGDPNDVYRVVAGRDNLMDYIEDFVDCSETDTYEVFAAKEIECSDGIRCLIPGKKLFSGYRN